MERLPAGYVMSIYLNGEPLKRCDTCRGFPELGATDLPLRCVCRAGSESPKVRAWREDLAAWRSKQAKASELLRVPIDN